MESRQDIIVRTMKSVIKDTCTCDKDTRTILDFINFLSKVNIIMFFNKNGIDTIMDNIKKSKDDQDLKLEFILNLKLKLIVNDLYVDDLAEELFNSLNTTVDSLHMSDNFKDLVEPDEDELNSSMGVMFIIKLYAYEVTKDL